MFTKIFIAFSALTIGLIAGVGLLSNSDARTNIEFLDNQRSAIDLSGQGLTSFPKELLNQTQMKILNVSHNEIESLPAEIGRFENLEELYLDDNKLSGALPAEIGNMKNLIILTASENQLTGIPAEIGELKNLEYLDFSLNNIDTFPNEIVNLKNTLKRLKLTDNNFFDGKMAELKSLLPNTTINF